MLKSRNCIRLGQVLMDENRQFFILCNNCHTDIKNMPDFRRHLEKCEGLENIFRKDHILKYNADKSTQLFGKTTKGIKEFLIYDYADVDSHLLESEKNLIDLMNIEEELLDPKWYSDSGQEENKPITQKSNKQYDVLVEEVTPFVQFKENVKNNAHITSNTTPKDVQDKNNISGQKLKTDPPEKPSLKRKLPATKLKNPPANSIPSLIQATSEIVVKKVSENLQGSNNFQAPLVKRYREERKPSKNVSGGPIPNPPHQVKYNQPSAAASIAQSPRDMQNNTCTKTVQTPFNQSPQPTKEKQTAQILNKLQNLGLQVKRTQTCPTPAVEASKKTDDKTLEILLKLQSKGMKVKVLNKQSAPTTPIKKDFQVPSEVPGNISQNRSYQTNVTVKQSMNKDLIIRKVK